MTLDPDNVRCGLEIEPGTGELIAGAYDGALYRVDKADGSATLIGDSGLAIDALGALPGAASPLAIPALSTVGLAILAGGFGLLALVSLGRRRARLNGA